MTLGGVILPETAKERPLLGTIVRCGPGKYDKSVEGKTKKMTVRAGAGQGAEASRFGRYLPRQAGINRSVCLPTCRPRPCVAGGPRLAAW